MLLLFSALPLLAFSAATALLISDLRAEKPRTRALGRFAHELGLVLTLSLLVAAAWEGGWAAPLRPGNAFALLAALLAFGSSLLGRRIAPRVMGAVTAPICAFLLLVHLLEVQRPMAAATDLGLVLVAHIGLALVGLGLFGMAAAIGLLYLVQERQLKARRFGRIFRRLPSLQELDAGGIRLVASGFAVYSVALALGGYWAHRTDADILRAEILFAIFAWCVFAAVLHLRISSGWRGRQSAVMTMVGFLSALGVLFLYVFF